jgi:hypothetical protein
MGLYRPLKEARNMRLLWDHPAIRPQLNILVSIVTSRRALCGGSVKQHIF